MTYSKCCRDAAQGFASLGNGIEYRLSSIPDSGDGLFVTRNFKKGEAINWYDGDLKHVLKIIGKVNLKVNASKEWSHWRSVPELDFDIRGIKRGYGAFCGRGGGSLINHFPEKQNCAFRNGTKTLSMFCEDDFQWWPVRPTLVFAIVDVFEGDELFVDYGASGTAAHEIPADVVGNVSNHY